MPGSALLAEVSMMTDGLQPGVNWSTVGKQAAYAGAVAFLGTVGGPALGKVAGVVAGAVGKLAVSDTTKHLLTDVLTRPVTETLGEGLFGIGASLIVDQKWDPTNLGADLLSGAISGAGGAAASGLGLVLSRAVMQPRVQVPHLAFTPDGKPVLPVGPTPVGGDTSTGYQAGIDDPKPAGAGAQAPPPPPVPLLPASNLPTPALDLPAPKLDLSVPSWAVSNLSMPAAPVPAWVAAAGGPVVEQWHGFQQDLADRYGGLLAGTGQARQFLAGLPVPVERVFTEWADARQGDPAVPVFLSQVGLPATALTGQFLFGVRDRAVARVTETLAGSIPAGGQIPAAVRPEQVVAALPGEFDRQALRSIAHLAVQHHLDQYFTTGAPATVPLPGGVVPPGDVVPPGGAGVPGGPGAPPPSEVVRAAVERDVRAHVDRSLDAILGATPLPTAPLTAPLTVPPAVPSAVVVRPDAAQVSAVADVVRQAVTDLPARVTAATIPDITAPHAIPFPADAPANWRTDAPAVSVTPEQHTVAATRQAETQFTALARKYGVVDPASHDTLAGSFQRDWVDGYHQVLAQATGNATPATPSVPGTSGAPATPSAPGAPGTSSAPGAPGTPDAAGARTTVPGGVAPRTDGTPNHDHTSDTFTVSDLSVSDGDIFSRDGRPDDTFTVSDLSSLDEPISRDGRSDDTFTVSDLSVSGDDMFSRDGRPDDTFTVSDLSSLDEPISRDPAKPDSGDRDPFSAVSWWGGSVGGDPAGRGEPASAAPEPAVAATGPAAAAESARRVADWIDQTPVGPDNSRDPWWWCVQATLDAFRAEYKRLGNRAVSDDRILGPDGRLAPTTSWEQLLDILDATPERVAHPDGWPDGVAPEDVLAALRAAPGSMVVVKAAPPNEPQHVFALHSQPQPSGPPTIK
ncbi:hypothetical protein, partial [Micromonospora olivasterospora]